jgi:hypothetical protein
MNENEHLINLLNNVKMMWLFFLLRYRAIKIFYVVEKKTKQALHGIG